MMAEHGDDGVEYVVADDLPTLVWLANLAALELHVPQWQVGRAAGRRTPTSSCSTSTRAHRPTSSTAATSPLRCATARRRRPDGIPEDLGQQGRRSSTSRSSRPPSERTSEYAKRLADRARRGAPRPASSRRWTRRLRQGKVFIDWSQNNAAKTTIAPYSLRGIDRPTVSTPLTWDEVAERPDGGRPAFTADDVLDRLEEHGDLLADMPDNAAAAALRSWPGEAAGSK